MKILEKKSFFDLIYLILVLGLIFGYFISRINKLTYENKNLCNKLHQMYDKKVVIKKTE